MRHLVITRLPNYVITVSVAALVVDRFLKVFVTRIPPQAADFSFASLGFERTNTSTILGVVPLGSTAAVVAMSVALLAMLVWILKNYQLPFIRYRFLLLILLGGASNLYDRVTVGAVSDVFRVAVGSDALVFNVADLMIVVGALLFVFRRSSPYVA